MSSKMRLSTLADRQQAKIVELSPNIRSEERRRLLDLGFIPGALIEVENRSPSGNPVAYRIKGAVIALRTQQTDQIYITTEGQDRL